MPNFLDRFTGGLLQSPAAQMGIGLLGAPRGATFGQGLMGATDQAIGWQLAQERSRRESQYRQAQEQEMMRRAQMEMIAREQAEAERRRREQANRYLGGILGARQAQMASIPDKDLPRFNQETRFMMGGLLGHMGVDPSLPSGLFGGTPTTSIQNIIGREDQEARLNREIRKGAIGTRQKVYADLEAKLDQFSGTIRGLKQFSDLATTGFGSNVQLAAAQIASAFGLSDNLIEDLTGVRDVAATEFFRSLSQGAAAQILGTIGQTLGPYSDRDTRRMDEMVPGMMRTPEGNKLVAEYMLYRIDAQKAYIDWARQHMIETNNLPTIQEEREFKQEYEAEHREKALPNFSQKLDKFEKRRADDVANQIPKAALRQIERDNPGATILSETWNEQTGEFIVKIRIRDETGAYFTRTIGVRP